MSFYAGVSDICDSTDHSMEVVLEPMKSKLNLGHSIYFDNFYNSYHLPEQLLEKDMHTGTLQKERKGNCKEVNDTKL